MNRRRVITIAIVVLVLLLALVLGLIWWSNQPTPEQPTNTNTPVNTSNTNTTVNTNTTTNTNTVVTPPAPVDRSERQAITSAASSFTERFGSYSSDTNFENIERSRYLMTANMSRQADALIRGGNDQDQFTSQDSTVAGVTITDYTDGATGATVEVFARQTLRTGQNNISYQNKTARLTLKKEGNRWLVDSFRWL